MYQLTKNEKTLIKSLKKLNLDNIEYLTSKELDSLINLSHKEILITAKHLKKRELVHVEFVNYDNKTDIGLIELTYEGAHCLEYSWLETKSFLYRSVIIPIGISIATSTILFWLANWIL